MALNRQLIRTSVFYVHESGLGLSCELHIYSLYAHAHVT